VQNRPAICEQCLEREHRKAHRESSGERNNSTLELVRNWCAYVEIKKDGAGGIVEQQTGLPIGPRYLTCPHAAAPGFIGSDLTFLALDFHDRNCVGCPNRKPVGQPNLSILVQEREAARATESAYTARREAEAAAARGARDAVRQVLRCGLAPPLADVVDQIEELDHGANADRLIETARLAPEVFTPPLVEYAFTLLESGESGFDNAGLGLLKTLSKSSIESYKRSGSCGAHQQPRSSDG
jgi:hypothetical protein